MMDDALVPQEQKALTPAETEKVEEIRKRIDLSDPNAVTQYGAAVQGRIAGFSDTILAEVKGRDTAEVGEALTSLMKKVKELDVDDLAKGDGGLLSKIPFVGSFVGRARGFMDRYQALSVQLTKIVEGLERSRTRLLKDVEMLEGFYEKDLEYYRDIILHIKAGEMKLEELNAQILPEMKTRAEETGDPIAAQRYRDLSQLAGRLDGKLHDLRLSRTVALQAAPQIRLVQHHNRELAEKIQSSVLNTIPLWKNQMVIAISLLRQRQALELQQEVSDTTRALLEKNAEMLKDGSIGAAEESAKGIVDIETLKKVNADLISTIEETIRIHGEGLVRRRLAEEELVRLERELKEKLLDLREQSRRGDD